MTPEERRRLDVLLLDVAARAAEEREVYLSALPEDEKEIAEEVRRRLRAAEDLPADFLSPLSTHFLGAACAGDEPGEAPPPESGDRFEIFECLGRGGAASVYRAFDHQLGRPVALKLLHAEDAETPRRLLREARAQARVRHEHVLDVYETGTLDDGRPFVVLRYVEGGTLADLATDRGSRRDARTDESREPGVTSLEERVRLVAQAAEGLHAAHREGLLHGDVKPSNVFVERDADGALEAWIGDFGIATELARRETETTPLAGTPDYMAPELWGQLRGASDRRTDVYSLGLTLFAVVAGELPPPGGRDFVALRGIAPELPPDLVAVVARAVAEDPAARYPSARAVAEDLRRFLDGEVVEAYADRLTYRLSRFVARHRALVTLGAISVVLLLAALSVAAVLGLRAMRANERIEERRAQAEELIGFVLVDLREKLEGVGRLDLMDEVGERAMGYFAAISEDELTDEELAFRSRALYQIGDVQMRRGELENAERAFSESLALARNLVERHPDDLERLYDLGQSEFWAGLVRMRQNELPDARRHFETYLDVARRLAAADPERHDWLQELSYAHSNLGSVLEREGDLEAALERFRSALEIDRRLLDAASEPEAKNAHRFELAASHNTVGVVLEELGRLDEAAEHYERDLEIRTELARSDPENRHWQSFLGTSHEFVGKLHFLRGDRQTARVHLDAARRIFDRLVQHDPRNADWRYRRALNRLNLGRLELAGANPQGEGEAAGDGVAEAAEAFQSAFEIASDLAAASPQRTAWLRLRGQAAYYLALCEAARPGGEAAARDHLATAVAVLEELAPDERSTATHLARSLVLSGDLDQRRGELAEAIRHWKRAVTVLAPWRAENGGNPETLSVWENLAVRLSRHDPESDSIARERETTQTTIPGGEEDDDPKNRR